MSDHNGAREQGTLLDCPNLSMNESEQLQRERGSEHTEHHGSLSFLSDSESPSQLVNDTFDPQSFLTSPDLGLNDFDFGDLDPTQKPAPNKSGPEMSIQSATASSSSSSDSCLPVPLEPDSTSISRYQELQSVDAVSKSLSRQHSQQHLVKHHVMPSSSSTTSSRVSGNLPSVARELMLTTDLLPIGI
jgi:hypothetical protein